MEQRRQMHSRVSGSQYIIVPREMRSEHTLHDAPNLQTICLQVVESAKAVLLSPPGTYKTCTSGYSSRNA
jgi:hypothetical protein